MPSTRLSLFYPQCEKDIIVYYSIKMVINPKAAERPICEENHDPNFTIFVIILGIAGCHTVRTTSVEK